MADLIPINKQSFPKHLVPFGFSSNQTGGHMARSMMLTELTELCRLMPESAAQTDFQRAIEQDNLLGKPTFGSRQKTYRHLVAFYGLNPNLALYRVFRRLASDDPTSIPLMGMVCAFCRDPQLRHSFNLIESLQPGEVLSRERMEAHLEEGFPGRFNGVMRKSLAQNVNTTWTVCGHLLGHSKKTKALPKAKFTSICYAVFAAWLSGLRGEYLLNSIFSRLVAADSHNVLSALRDGSIRGWLRLRSGGGVTEIDFLPLLTENETPLLHGSH